MLGLCVQFPAEQHFHSELWELCWWFLFQYLGHKLSVCTQIFQSCFPLQSSKLKPTWRPEFTWDWTSFFIWADKGDEDICYQINSWTSELCFWEAAGLQCLVTPGREWWDSSRCELAQDTSWSGVTELYKTWDKGRKGIIQPCGISHTNMPEKFWFFFSSKFGAPC